MENIDVDIIIAVHTPERPIERAVASVLRDNFCKLRITVVCHNIEVEPINARLGQLAVDSRVRVVCHKDGERSPAGPFNYGLKLATADFTSVMGSDDTLEPGAVDSWLKRATKVDADVVIARVAHSGAGSVPTPPVRALRIHNLDFVKDRLSYRTAPLGLVSQRKFGHLRMAEGVRTGEDIEYGLALWSQSVVIEFDRRGPKYLIHDDGVHRVTTVFADIEQDTEFLEKLLVSETFESLKKTHRLSFITKLIRGSLFNLVTNRMDVTHWIPQQRTALSQVGQQIIEAIGKEAKAECVNIPSLSIAEQKLLKEILDPNGETEKLLAAAKAVRNRLSFESLCTPRLRDAFRADAPLRFTVASVLLLR